MTARRKEVEDLLSDNGGVVFCKLRRVRKSLSVITRDDEREINIYSWLPRFGGEQFFGSTHLANRKGSRLNTRKSLSPLNSFVQDCSDKFSYEAVLQREQISSELDITPLAKTPTEDFAAFFLPCKAGHLIFLPARMDLDKSARLELLERTRTLLDKVSFSNPSWLDRYQVPEEEELSQQLEEINRDIAELEDVRATTSRELESVKSFKWLLSARTDAELEASLRGALGELGFEPEEACSGIDLLLSLSEDTSFAIKVGANPDGPVGLGPYRELVQGINDLKIFENKDPQGVVIVNGYAEEVPDSRENQTEEELESGCNLYGFTLVTAQEIYETIEKAKKVQGSPREKLIDLLQNA